MANIFAFSSAVSSAFAPIGATGDAASGGLVIFEVTSAASLIFDVQAQVEGSGSTPADITYYNMLADPRTKVTAGTDITANGIYGVVAPGMVVGLKCTAGTGTVTVKVVEGAI